jgi:twitching motility protein PilI
MQDLNSSDPLHKRGIKKIARRHQLREFQKEIAEKTFRSEGKNIAPDHRRLGVQVGEDFLFMHLVQTGEVLSSPVITPVPNTKAWFLGLFSHRDRLIGLTDLAGLLGHAVSENKKTDKVLTCAPSISMHCAFRITRIVGLIDIAGMTSEVRTEKESPWLSQEYIDSNKVKWTEINLQKLINHPAFVNIAL